jgi:hypothetical protein
LRNANGVGSSELLGGIAAAEGIYGPMGLDFGTVFGAWSTPAKKASPTEGSPVWGGTLAQRLKMTLGNKSRPLIRCLLVNGYEVWVHSDKLSLIIILRIRSFPSDPFHSNGLQAIKKSITSRICSGDWIFRDMWVRIFLVRLFEHPHMQHPPTRKPTPFVYIVDSPSASDLLEGYSIGMGLRDALKAIRIPHVYTLAINKQMLGQALNEKLHQSIFQWQAWPNVDAVPLIHLCMHGADQGIALTDNTYLFWPDLRSLLLRYNYIKGNHPFLCMASCHGISASSMVSAHDQVFSYLIGNGGNVLQNDLTVAYLAFYNHIFKGAPVHTAVDAMKIASGDPNFYAHWGPNIQNQRFHELTATQPFYVPSSF